MNEGVKAEIPESATETGEKNVSGEEQNQEFVPEMLAADRMKPNKSIRRHPVGGGQHEQIDLGSTAGMRKYGDDDLTPKQTINLIESFVLPVKSKPKDMTIFYLLCFVSTFLASSSLDVFADSDVLWELSSRCSPMFGTLAVCKKEMKIYLNILCGCVLVLLHL